MHAGLGGRFTKVDIQSGRVPLPTTTSELLHPVQLFLAPPPSLHHPARPIQPAPGMVRVRMRHKTAEI